ncbi:hypothetical protein AB7813_08170 [Tardiphaga sp. 20_F10_N6_6]|uniref:hypothetical protein n=1 Tax=Tardiphaga sp. 20_F10_N6_6 TaxID=3240788 RepID=UPI003F8CDEEF
MNRETWLNELAAKLAPRFEELGHPLPKFRVSIGFTSGGANGGANGQCWSDACTDDKHYTIFISPSEATSMAIAAILNHELIHAAVGLKEGHKGEFAAMMKATGMVRPFTSSVPGDEFKAWVQPFIDELGEIPHAQLKVRGEGGVKLFKKGGGGVDAAGGDGDGEPVNDLPKKQTTRLLKCECTECGYTVRVTKRWLDVGVPHCHEHGAMEAANDNAPGEDSEAA